MLVSTSVVHFLFAAGSSRSLPSRRSHVWNWGLPSTLNPTSKLLPIVCSSELPKVKLSRSQIESFNPLLEKCWLTIKLRTTRHLWEITSPQGSIEMKKTFLVWWHLHGRLFEDPAKFWMNSHWKHYRFLDDSLYALHYFSQHSNDRFPFRFRQVRCHQIGSQKCQALKTRFLESGKIDLVL